MGRAAILKIDQAAANRSGKNIHIAIAIEIIEALLAAEQGVVSFAVSFGQTGSFVQDIATAHSAACGWPLARYLETRTAWVVRSHHIEYERPAFAGESLTALTWIRAFGARSSPRRYAFWRPSDRALLAKAETMWVFVDGRLGKPARIPDEFRSAFTLVPDEKAVLQALDAGAFR